MTHRDNCIHNRYPDYIKPKLGDYICDCGYTNHHRYCLGNHGEHVGTCGCRLYELPEFLDIEEKFVEARDLMNTEIAAAWNSPGYFLNSGGQQPIDPQTWDWTISEEKVKEVFGIEPDTATFDEPAESDTKDFGWFTTEPDNTWVNWGNPTAWRPAQSDPKETSDKGTTHNEPPGKDDAATGSGDINNPPVPTTQSANATYTGHNPHFDGFHHIPQHDTIRYNTPMTTNTDVLLKALTATVDELIKADELHKEATTNLANTTEDLADMTDRYNKEVQHNEDLQYQHKESINWKQRHHDTETEREHATNQLQTANHRNQALTAQLRHTQTTITDLRTRHAELNRTITRREEDITRITQYAHHLQHQIANLQALVNTLLP